MKEGKMDKAMMMKKGEMMMKKGEMMTQTGKKMMDKANMMK